MGVHRGVEFITLASYSLRKQGSDCGRQLKSMPAAAARSVKPLYRRFSNNRVNISSIDRVQSTVAANLADVVKARHAMLKGVQLSAYELIIDVSRKVIGIGNDLQFVCFKNRAYDELLSLVLSSKIDSRRKIDANRNVALDAG
ncbi:MAG: hypothetical protein A4S17_02655 [Proteobacteria bacterium HN_bin10]|nr:MAG: hypothetical protein A4S17_02655 [Proteobacteria bacterium HN_bin10]